MRLLLVHSCSLEHQGGAELSIRNHLASAPSHVEINVILPDDPVDLINYDTVILCNLRPSGGLGEKSEYRWAKLWANKIKGYRGYVIRSEHDAHPCATRDVRCIRTDPLERIDCNCRRSIPNAFEKLYNLCDTVRFLSPLHRHAINKIINIKNPLQCDIASPINPEQFKNVRPFHLRKHAAIITGDALRIAPEAYSLAEAAGYPVEQVEYLSVKYDDMAELYNQYKAVVIAPIMIHAFCRMVVEAQLCGCEVITNNRVGATSWSNPIEASKKSNEEFWNMVADRPEHPNPKRINRLAFWK